MQIIKHLGSWNSLLQWLDFGMDNIRIIFNCQ